MDFANSENVSAPSDASTPAGNEAPPHWLHGRYFVPMPDLRDEVREQISKGRAWPVFSAIMSLLHDRERRGPVEDRRDAAAGRIEGVGIGGLALACRMSPGAVLRQVRVLEQIGLIQTTQAGFSMETNQATGRIVRNYRRVPPKGFQVSLQDHHMRPVGAAKRRSGGTHDPAPNVSGGTHGTDPNRGDFRVRNRRVSKERTSKEVRSFGTNKRRTAAGALGGPAAAAAPGSSPAAPATAPASEEQRQAFFAAIGDTLGMTVAEVAATPPEARPDILERFHAAHGRHYDRKTGRVSRAADEFSRLTMKERPRRIRPSRLIDGIAPPQQQTDQERECVSGVSRQDSPSAAATSPPAAEAAADTHEPVGGQAAASGHPLAPDRMDRPMTSPAVASDPDGPVRAGRAADEAGDRLRRDLEQLPDESRQRAADIGHVVEQADEEAERLSRLIEDRRNVLAADEETRRRHSVISAAVENRRNRIMSAGRVA